MPSGQRDESASVILKFFAVIGTVAFVVVVVLAGLRVIIVLGGEVMHSQTDGLVLGTSDRTMISLEGHIYSLWSGLNCNLFPLL